MKKTVIPKTKKRKWKWEGKEKAKQEQSKRTIRRQGDVTIGALIADFGGQTNQREIEKQLPRRRKNKMLEIIVGRK